MTTLITGGTGFLGSSLAQELVKEGESVVLFNRSANRDSVPPSIVDKVLFARGDLSCWPEVLDVVNKHNINTIFHCGALLSESAEKFPFKAYEINTLGTWHILEAARLFDVEKILFASSIAAFGAHITDPVSNTAPQYPSTIYGVSKVSSERLGEYYNTKFNIDFRGVRFPSVIGPGRGPGGASAYSSLIFEKPVLGEPYTVYVEAHSCIPLLYIKDAVKALIKLKKADNNDLNYRMYNIAGFSPTVDEIQKEIKKTIPEAMISIHPDEEMVRIVNSWPDALDDSEAQKDWGWKNDFDIHNTILDFNSELLGQKV